MRKTKTIFQWVIDQYAANPKIETITAAHALWHTLDIEWQYRIALSDHSDGEVNALAHQYAVRDDIARAMVKIEAVTGIEVSKKIDVALEYIEAGWVADDLQFRLLQSAGNNAVLLDGDWKRKAA